MSRAWTVPDIEPDASLAVNARRILAVRIGEMWSYAPIMPEADRTEALHDARIAGKRLRYTLELFRPVFGEAGEAATDAIKALQEDLGTLHDTDVRIALLEDAIAALPAPDHAGGSIAAHTPSGDPATGLTVMLKREAAGRAKRHAAVAKRWDRLNRDGLRSDLVALSAMPLDD